MKNIVTDYGAVAGTDCTTMFAAAMLDGGAIYVPAGTYTVSATSDACIVATKPTRLIGDGMTLSTIWVDASSSVDGLTLRPLPNGTSQGWGLDNIGIVPASPRSMQHAVRIDLSATGAWLANCVFNNIFLIAGTGADSAFRLDNPANLDGLFCGEITGKSIIVGGIKLLNLGDSFAVRGATLTGPNVGFYASAVPGAAQCKLLDCNITATGGAVFLQSFNQAQIIGNQTEQSSAYDGPFNGMFVLSGCINCNLINNNMNSHGNTCCVVIENASTGNILRGNVMYALNIASLSHLQVGPGSPSNALASDNRCYDASSGAHTAAYAYVSGSSPMWPL